MSRRELLAFDKVLAQYLEPQTLLKRLEASVDEDYSAIFQGRQIVEQAKQRETAEEYQKLQEPNT